MEQIDLAEFFRYYLSKIIIVVEVISETKTNDNPKVAIIILKWFLLCFVVSNLIILVIIAKGIITVVIICKIARYKSPNGDIKSVICGK